jgi:thiol-disulfide isomerase/thioredoxin
VAKAGDAAPQFTAKTLKGENFTNGSFRGQVALLQFWATWCPHCRSDQPVLDNIAREFSGEGLVVLAVDVKESADTVKEYLDEHPRSCNVVLSDDTNLVTQFAPKGFPYYVLIDRDGNVAGTQNGAGGDSSLRHLLRLAGIGVPAVTAMPGGAQRAAGAKTTSGIAAKLIDIPGGQSAALAKPLPPTVFVLKTGEKLEAEHYAIMGDSVRIDAHGNKRIIPIAALDVKSTTAANHERGIELKIPTNPNEVYLGF